MNKRAKDMNPMSNHEKKDHLQSSRGKGIPPVLIDPQKFDVITFNMIKHPAGKSFYI